MKCASLLYGLLLALPAGSAFAGTPEVGLRLVLQAHGATATEIAQTAEVIRQRLNMLDVDDPQVSANGDRLSILIGGVGDPERARRLILSRASLDLRLVRLPTGRGGAASSEEILQAFGGQLPPSLAILEGDLRGDNSEKKGTQYYAVEKQAVITGADFASVRPSLGEFGQPTLEFRLKPEAAKIFGDMTEKNVGSSLAIVLNGRVVSAPMIRSRIYDSGVIEGGFTQQEAIDLATVLRSGTVPELTVVEEQIFTPSPAGVKRRRMFLITGLFLLGFLVAAVLYSRRHRKASAGRASFT